MTTFFVNRALTNLLGCRAELRTAKHDAISAGREEQAQLIHEVLRATDEAMRKLVELAGVGSTRHDFK